MKYQHIYFVEIWKPPTPAMGIRWRTHRHEVDRDVLHPGLIWLVRVIAWNKDDAVGKAMLGDGVTIIGGRS